MTGQINKIDNSWFVTSEGSNISLHPGDVEYAEVNAVNYSEDSAVEFEIVQSVIECKGRSNTGCFMDASGQECGCQETFAKLVHSNRELVAKQKFYEYGKSLDVKTNDLQRLMMLAKSVNPEAKVFPQVKFEIYGSYIHVEQINDTVVIRSLAPEETETWKDILIKYEEHPHSMRLLDWLNENYYTPKQK
jgi:hypothetical protein